MMVCNSLSVAKSAQGIVMSLSIDSLCILLTCSMPQAHHNAHDLIYPRGYCGGICNQDPS